MAQESGEEDWEDLESEDEEKRRRLLEELELRTGEDLRGGTSEEEERKKRIKKGQLA